MKFKLIPCRKCGSIIHPYFTDDQGNLLPVAKFTNTESIVVKKEEGEDIMIPALSMGHVEEVKKRQDGNFDLTVVIKEIGKGIKIPINVFKTPGLMKFFCYSCRPDLFPHPKRSYYFE